MMEQKKGMKVLSTREIVVEFIHHDPNAMRVYLAGEFNSWEAKSLPMQKKTGRNLGGRG
jgi:1,4-alpha-glucan branching enzyme